MTGWSRRLGAVVAFVGLFGVSLPTVQAQTSVSQGEWRSYGADNASTKYSPLDQITASNFDQLRIAWSWDTADVRILAAHRNDARLRGAGFKATPLMVGGVLFVSTGLGQIAALDATTGRTRWVYDPESYTGGPPANVIGFQTRGVAYWSEGTNGRILFGTNDGYLVAIDARTGAPISEFGNNGRVDLTTGIPGAERGKRPQLAAGESYYVSVNSPPIVVRDVVIVGSSMTDRPNLKEWPAGHVQAFDVRTGARRWVFHTVPRSDDLGVETWESDSWRYSGGSNVWSMMSADEEAGYVYLPTGTPASDYYGGHRLGDNLFAESLVCVDVETGEHVWHFQFVHHGLWDYDTASAPNLVDLTVDGRRVKAVAQVTKQGFTYVLDRITGEPVWPIEERPVPPSDVPGERAAPTQPFPTRPAPFERQGITTDDLIDFTPELRSEALSIASHYRLGPIFTPPSLYVEDATRGTIQLPGPGGGANWGGAAVDPNTGVLYVPSRTAPTMVVLTEPDPDVSDLRYIRSGTLGPGSAHPARPALPRGPQGLPLVKPPYSRMTAIDLKTGDHVWMVPTGIGATAIREHPALAGVTLPPLGGLGGVGGPLLTKTLLVYALLLDSPASEGAAALVAYDRESGVEWSRVLLPAVPTGTPMTYMVDDVQYIAFPVATSPPRLLALALR